MSTAAWARFDGEPEQAYHVFSIWLSMPAPRPSVDRFCGSFNVEPWIARGWALRYGWARRAALYDEHFAALKRAEAEAAEAADTPAQTRAREREILALAREFTAHELGKLVVQSKKSGYAVARPREIAQILRMTIELSRDANAPSADDLEWGDDLSDEELATFDAIVQRARGGTGHDIG